MHSIISALQAALQLSGHRTGDDQGQAGIASSSTMQAEDEAIPNDDLSLGSEPIQTVS